MNLSNFDYSLPESLIAQCPCAERDAARLMVVDRASQTIRQDVFRNLGKYLPPGTVCVVNDSRVIPSRLLGRRAETGGKVEVFLLRRISDGPFYEALLRPLKKLKEGEKIIFEGSSATVQVVDPRNRLIRFNQKNIQNFLKRHGHMPLPPYIKRLDLPEDKEDYQTIFARRAGSVAAPTAGLHFTPALAKDLTRSGHEFLRATLHINYATFKPVEEEDVTQHQMHFEAYALSRDSWKKIQAARNDGRCVAAVGTTSCRVLETVALCGKLNGNTNLFIYPGYAFRSTDILITNFHLPRSTLLMLVYAFGGMELMKKAYQQAIAERCRFYSYGDAMVIL